MRVLLTGASGQLGAYLLDDLQARGHEVIAWSGSERGERCGCPLLPVDLDDLGAVGAGLEGADAEAVLHAGAMSTADGVRREPDRARRVNVEATRVLAAWCAREGRRLVFTSTDLVFDGSRGWNTEADPAEPLLLYGRTKREAETPVAGSPRGLVSRLSLLYGFTRCDRPAFFDRAVAAWRRGEPQSFFEDEYRTPLDLASASRALVRLLEGDATGTVHVGGPERMSRFDLMRRAAVALGIDPALVRANRRGNAPLAEPRPADVSLDTRRLAALLPDLRRASVEEVLTSTG